MQTPEEALLEKQVINGDRESVLTTLSREPELLRAHSPIANGSIMYLVALYGYSGRTKRYQPVIDALIGAGYDFDLFEAALLDFPDVVTRLLQEDPSLVNTVDPYGRTPLHYGAQRGSLEVVNLLLRHGANPNVRTPDGETPIMEASHPGPMKDGAENEIIERLFERGAVKDVFILADLGYAEELDDYLEQHPEHINAQDERGATPLYHAAHNLHPKTIELLLQKGADVNLATEEGSTPIATAADHIWDYKGPDTVDLIMKMNPTLDFFTACQLGKTERVRALLEEKPGWIHERKGGWSALYLTCGNGHTETVALLIEQGANVNERNAEFTPLHNAIAHPGVVKLLLDHGADPKATDANGRTPIDLARERGLNKAVSLLESDV